MWRTTCRVQAQRRAVSWREHADLIKSESDTWSELEILAMPLQCVDPLKLRVERVELVLENRTHCKWFA